MSEHWPPEWEDPEEEFPGEADQSDATVLAGTGEARLSEVSAYLASVPAPVLPDAVEARINAALAAEAATRVDHAAPVDPPRKLGPKLIRARVRRHGGSGRPRLDSRSRPLLVVGSLVVCLLVGLGFVLARGSTPTYSGLAGAAPAAGANHPGAVSAAGVSASRGTVPVPAPAASASASAGIAESPRSAAAASAASSSSSSASSQYSEAGPNVTASFLVTASGTKYQQATLAGQVSARLGGTSTPVKPGPTVTAAPSASSSASVSAAVPSQALRGCVFQLTGGVVPRLVDRATYQGEPAYVIASSSRVWVVGLGCTADKTELITSVPLAGLPGNLHGLVSVEQ